jgi:Flp pilus assembly protein TadG
MKMRKRQAERGIAVIATTIMLVILIPVIGLAIDVTLVYVDKARLQGANVRVPQLSDVILFHQ